MLQVMDEMEGMRGQEAPPSGKKRSWMFGKGSFKIFCPFFSMVNINGNIDLILYQNHLSKSLPFWSVKLYHLIRNIIKIKAFNSILFFLIGFDFSTIIYYFYHGVGLSWTCVEATEGLLCYQV
jgi:hypothetical protein